MAAATAVIIVASMQKSLPLFTTAFIALFVLSGLGNGSTFKMIPGIFHAKALAKGLEGEEAAAYGRRLSGASMGLIGAVGALGGLGINLAFRQSFLTVGSGTGAFVAFLAFYGLCFAVTWAVYLRRPAAAQTDTAPATDAKPQLSYAEV
jgi:NNP family nitrate/nitrite transporter-like MFS transporter